MQIRPGSDYSNGEFCRVGFQAAPGKKSLPEIAIKDTDEIFFSDIIAFRFQEFRTAGRMHAFR